MAFEVLSTSKIEGLKIVRSERRQDERGFFQETYRESVFHELGLPRFFVQHNVSRSVAGVLRGLHFQEEPFAQGKLIFVLEGAAWTVALDMRKSSRSFGSWEGFEVRAEVGAMIYLPPGLAHGFLALEDCLYCYKTTKEYHPEAERGIRWNDPDLAISWPKLPVLVSEKDQNLPTWKDLRIV